MHFELPLVIDARERSTASAGRIELIDPDTEQPWAEVPAAGTAELDEALCAADRAFRQAAWAHVPAAERSDALRRIADAIRSAADELARLEARNVGKPIGDARWEVEAGARCFDYYAGILPAFGGQTIPVRGGGFDYTLHVPVGVVAAIVPWNFPFLMACWKVAPALAAGCAVLLKPASLTPLSALRLGQIGIEAGLPAGILQVLAGRSRDIGDALVTHPLVRKIAFTGETATGARIVSQAAGDIKRVSLELGGKSPNIVFADADLDAAAAAAPMCVFGNAGQDCCARSRVLVEATVYDRFLEAFVAATRALRIGPPLEEATQVGPLVSADQRATVERYLALAREEGGRIVTGGARPRERGYYLEPAIVDALASSARTCQEEIFGPVASVLPFRDEREALELANDTVYGLSASLWTRDLERALRLARHVEAGVMSVNTNSSVYQEAPFGGFKQSGLGRELGLDALRLYSEIKNVFIRVPESC